MTHRRCTGSLGCGALLEYVNGNPVGHDRACKWKERSLAFNADLSARLHAARPAVIDDDNPTQEEAMATQRNGKCTTVAYGELSRDKLLAMAKGMGLTKLSALNKGDLIAAMQAHVPGSTSEERVAATKMASNRAAVKPKPHAVDEAAEEQAALKAWEKGGRRGKRPDTSHYDALITTKLPTMRKAPKPKSSGGRTKRQVRYVRNGKPLSDSMNGLGTLAYHNTAGIGGKKVERIGTAELRAVLSQLGVEDADVPGWSVTLPNGQVIAAVPIGTPLEAIAKSAPAKKVTAAKKAPAKRATKAPTKRATPKKASSKLTVRTKARPDGTPIPKAGTRKK